MDFLTQRFGEDAEVAEEDLEENSLFSLLLSLRPLQISTSKKLKLFEEPRYV